MNSPFFKAFVVISSLCVFLNFTSVTSTNAGSPEECIRLLRDVAYNEAKITINSEVSNSLRNAICKSELHSRNEFSKAGLGVGAAIYGVPFKLDGSLDAGTFEVWKTANCENLEVDFSAAHEATILTRFVSPEAPGIYNSCVSASGLFCAISSPSPELINVQLNWTPFPGSKAYTTVRSSTVVNATSLQPNAPSGQLVPVKFAVLYGGAIVQLNRSDIRRPVNVTVNTDNGACGTLYVPAEGDFTANIEIGGTAEFLRDSTQSVAISSVNNACGANKKLDIGSVCATFPATDVQILDEKSTFGITPSLATVSIMEGCAVVEATLTGPPYDTEEYTELVFWTEGINHSRPMRFHQRVTRTRNVCLKENTYTATVSLSGQVWKREPIPNSKSTATGRNNSIAFVYEKSMLEGSTVRDISYVYHAIVSFPGSDGRTVIVEVDSANPTKSESGSTVRSGLDPVNGSVLLFLEKPNVPNNMARVNELFDVQTAPVVSMTSEMITSEDFELDLYNSETLQTLGMVPADR